MPIPSPTNKETKEKFIDRCMSSNVMNSEFPDAKQRFAVCNSKWKNKKTSAENDTVEYLIKAFIERHPELKGVNYGD